MAEPSEFAMSKTVSDDATFVSAETYWLKVPCGFAAPLVVNGAAFVGCQLQKGHEGQHSITIKWGD